MPQRIRLVLEDEAPEVDTMTHIADDYQAAADWLMGELGNNNPDSPYPPVPDEAALVELVELINDKIGVLGAELTWTYVS